MFSAARRSSAEFCSLLYVCRLIMNLVLFAAVQIASQPNVVVMQNSIFYKSIYLVMTVLFIKISLCCIERSRNLASPL